MAESSKLGHPAHAEKATKNGAGLTPRTPHQLGFELDPTYLQKIRLTTHRGFALGNDRFKA